MAPRASGFDWATIGRLGSHRIHGFYRLFVLELNPSFIVLIWGGKRLAISELTGNRLPMSNVPALQEFVLLPVFLNHFHSTGRLMIISEVVCSD